MALGLKYIRQSNKDLVISNGHSTYIHQDRLQP